MKYESYYFFVKVNTKKKIKNMFVPEENSIINEESDSDSNFEDEDDLTRIVPPEGKWKNTLYFKSDC